MTFTLRRGAASLLLVLAFAQAASVQAQSAGKPPAGFNVNQAIAGKAAYDLKCGSCHGADLMGSGPALPLRGPAFQRKWADRSPAKLFADIRRMPPGQPDSVPAMTSA